MAFEHAVKGARLTEALEIYRGDLLPGFFSDAPQFDAWLDIERHRLRELAIDAAWQLATRYEAEDQITLAGRVARSVVRMATTDERMLRRVLVMLERAGDYAGAAQTYKEFVARLRQELDVGPSPETQALMRRIQGQSP
ncbi:MAG: AfsR/SARP family transcriptional regulator [Gemmatimonas sp.]